MSFEITSGIIKKGIKVVLYGVEGIGKSTLAAQFPAPLFIDTEGSTNTMRVSRLPKPTSWQMLMEEVDYVKQTQNCDTLVVDTADWADYLCQEFVISKDANAKSIEDFGYGKGYVMVREEFGRLLNRLSDLTEVGINVVVTAHAEQKKNEVPDEIGAYDKYQLKLSRQASPLLREWADMLLFLNYKITIVTDSKTQSKKATGGARVMYTSHHPAWEAKNRFGLPEEVALDYSSIAHLFTKQVQPNVPPVTVQEVIPEMPNEPVQEELVPVPKHDSNQFAREELALDSEIPKQLADLMLANEVTEPELRAVVARNGFFPEETAVKDYPSDFVDGALIANWPQILGLIKENRKF